MDFACELLMVQVADGTQQSQQCNKYETLCLLVASDFILCHPEWYVHAVILICLFTCHESVSYYKLVSVFLSVCEDMHDNMRYFIDGRTWNKQCVCLDQ